MTDISDLANKVENDGINEQGRLSSEDFNRLVMAVQENQRRGVTVDDSLNSSSTNPVQNKVINDALHVKVGSINVTSIAIVDGRLVVTTNAGDTYAFEPVQPIEEIVVLLEDGNTLTAEDGSVIVF